MAFNKETKQQIMTQYRKSELDTGSSQVQIALMTRRIQYLTEHFKTHKKDVHGRRGLIRLVNKRRKLLDYLKKRSPNSYGELIQSLGLRK